MLILTVLGASTLLRFWILMFIWVAAHRFQEKRRIIIIIYECQKKQAKCVKSLHINNNAINFLLFLQTQGSHSFWSFCNKSSSNIDIEWWKMFALFHESIGLGNFDTCRIIHSFIKSSNFIHAYYGKAFFDMRISKHIMHQAIWWENTTLLCWYSWCWIRLILMVI
jgi:hypothetical protein